jgi:hypothetical protein
MNRDVMVQAIDIIGALTIFPPILFGIWFFMRERRKSAALTATALFSGPEETGHSSLFSRACSFSFPELDAPQRAYLLRQRTVLALGLISTWIFFIWFSAGLLPQYVSAYAAQQPLPLRVWYSYLYHISSGATSYGIFAFLAAGQAIVEFGNAPWMGRFFRTRPLTRSFVFWTRTGLTLGAFISSLLLAAAASFLLLLLTYGPVWKHLDNGNEPTIANARSQPAPSSDDVLGSVHSGEGHATWALQTSVPRLFLSIVTTQTFFFSLMIAMAMLPIRFGRMKSILVIAFAYAVFICYIFYVVAGNGIPPHLAQIFFLYVQPGPPPPYRLALVPLTVSAALLALAAVSNRRNDS